MNKFSFNVNNVNCAVAIKNSLDVVYKTFKPVIVCIGSDLAVGDSLGPLVGSMLCNSLKGKAYVYGTLESPVTAKETVTIFKTIKLLHPNSKILAIDAGLGNKSDVGLVKVSNNGIKPGLGVSKTLPTIGDASIIGIVAEKFEGVENIFTKTRLNLVYKLAGAISNGIEKFLA